jgi:hypothetical protein
MVLCGEEFKGEKKWMVCMFWFNMSEYGKCLFVIIRSLKGGMDGMYR